MPSIDMIVQSLLCRSLIVAVPTLVLESTIMVRLIMHVHRRLILLYYITMRAAVLARRGFLINIDHFN